jgi:hypothetical protein
MKLLTAFMTFASVAVLTNDSAFGQVWGRQQARISYSVPQSAVPMTKNWSLPGLRPDRQTTYKQRNPSLSLPVHTTALLGNYYWMGSVTQQSYNKGKVGRYYYWDVQGNLRGSYLFLDIAGKNKRGLKLVFPRHRALF